MRFRGISEADALKWQRHVREHLTATLQGGRLPLRAPLEPKVAGVVEKAGYNLMRVNYRSTPIRENYALLSVPISGGEHPALVALHGHELQVSAASTGGASLGQDC